MRPEVVVANVIHSFFVVEASAREGIPCIWIIHESYDRPTLLHYFEPICMPLLEQAFEKAARVVFVSEETRRLYQHFERRRNFRVIYNGITREWLADLPDDRGRQAARIEFLRRDAEFVIVSVGTVCERKSQETLVRACSILARQRREFHCFLVGERPDEPYVPYLQRLIRKLDLQERVTLVPETPEVHRYLAAADVLAFTSLNESYSLAILEAMAAGLPIVTTPCVGVGEQVRYGVNAMTFPFRGSSELAERLQHLMDDPALRRRLGDNSRHIFSYLPTFEQMLRSHERSILEVWQESSSPRGSMAALELP